MEKTINNILEELESDSFIKIVVDKETGKHLKDKGLNVEIADIDKGTFIIKFDNFSLESKLKEKMETIKNEIKREIKENT